MAASEGSDPGDTDDTAGVAGVAERARRRLRDHYRGSLQERLVELDAWCWSFAATDAEQIDAIRRAGHQMRGSGASFGFPAISARGGAVEDAPIETLHAALVDLLDEVRRALVELESPAS